MTRPLNTEARGPSRDKPTRFSSEPTYYCDRVTVSLLPISVVVLGVYTGAATEAGPQRSLR
jgi:hypothetical protein